ncbi:MAG: hypothetical protein QOJ02_832 [Acidobacteriota bacterium]|nr:hypothetical protein [Acidobacteriota bacterium]
MVLGKLSVEQLTTPMMAGSLVLTVYMNVIPLLESFQTYRSDGELGAKVYPLLGFESRILAVRKNESHRQVMALHHQGHALTLQFI